MPLPVPQRALAREQLRGFLGVNLRRDILSLVDGDLARAINADLHTVAGLLRLRRGRAALTDDVLPDVGGVRMVTRQDNRRYQLAGTTWYRSFTSIRSGLHSDLVNTLITYRPLNDTGTWVFLADKNGMYKDSGSAVRLWGIVAPTDTPVAAIGGAGALTGNYSARYTYARVVGGNVAHESNPSPASNTVTLSADDLNVDVVASTDPQVTNIRIYRTVAGGVAHLFDTQVANTTATRTLTQADSALGSQVETDNNPPPACGWATEFQGSIFLLRDDANPHYLWYSKRFLPESFPSSQFLLIGTPGDPLQCAVSLTGFLGVFTRLTKYRVLGNTISGFFPQEALSTRGTPAPQAVLPITGGAIFPARDGLFLTNFVAADEELTQTIQPLFYGETIHDNPPIDWAHVGRMSLTEYKQRYYFSYRDIQGTDTIAVYSRDTQKWYFYQHPVRSLYFEEATDQLLMGGTDGTVWILENGTFHDNQANISLTAHLPVRAGGDPLVKKRFDYVRVEAIVPSGTLSVALYVDGALKHTLAITGTRDRTLHRLPPGIMGYTWQARLSYAGQGALEVQAVEVQFVPMGAA